MKITRDSSTRIYLRRVFLKEFLDILAVPASGVYVPFTCYRRCLACTKIVLCAIQRFVCCCICIAWRVRIQPSPPCVQCIIKRRRVSEGGGGCSVWLHCDRKTERSGRALGRKYWDVSSSGGFAPAPPGFSALVPLPMGGLNPRLKKGCYGIPPRSVEATESALRLLPSRALSSAQFMLIITRPGRRTRPLWRGPGIAHCYLGGKMHVGTNHLPPKEATRHE
jgi:hypothetical protein